MKKKNKNKNKWSLAWRCENFYNNIHFRAIIIIIQLYVHDVDEAKSA